ncbi:hypothetical protein ACJIZ3_011814 [Penstemon smallii]|uniref:Serine/threonine-protein kinase BSK1-like TPR repeats domain-containing protein n=1 Tax=Penstemon smallii TaxID=265156 RepID=A0ABD3UKA1_9LAMI
MNTPAEISILKAAADGNLQLLQQLAVADAEGFLEKCERAKDCQGLTALHRAAVVGKTRICKFLIEDVKVNINAKTDKGDTPLLLAIKADRLRTAIYLTQQGVDVNESDFKGKTPLHCAAENGHPTLIRLLISKGAEIEAVYDYETPLLAAASKWKKEAVKILLDRNANVGINSFPNSASRLSLNPVMLSILNQSIECLDMLLKAGADPNTRSCGLTPLVRAAFGKDTEYMKLLLKAGANPDEVDQAGLTPLEIAALAANRDGVMLLLPMTSWIPSIPDWSFHGIMSHVRSEDAKNQRERNLVENHLMAKNSGEAAFMRKDYLNAMFCYTEALFINKCDAKVLSNRSLCWAHLNHGDRALKDAEDCVKFRPDWPKAHYREGVAWMLLKNYSMASEAFSLAKRLDPESKEIHKAFKEAVEAEFDMEVSDDIQVLHIPIS